MLSEVVEKLKEFMIVTILIKQSAERRKHKEILQSAEKFEKLLIEAEEFVKSKVSSDGLVDRLTKHTMN